MIVPNWACVFTGPNVYPHGQFFDSPGSFGSGSACAIPALNARANSADPAAMIGRVRMSST
jgi:hypothetical protein